MEPSNDIEKKKKHATLGVVFLTIFVSMIGFGIVIPVLPDYAKNDPFKLSPHALGWLTGIFSLVQLFTAPLLGKLSDRIGRKPVLLVSIFGTAVGYFVTGAAQASWMLFLGRIIDGASGGNIAAAQASVADVTTPKERSKAMGLIGAAFGLGFVLGPAIGGLLSAYVGHAAPFYFAGALSLINLGLAWKKFPETLHARRASAAAGALAAETEAASAFRPEAPAVGETNLNEENPYAAPSANLIPATDAMPLGEVFQGGRGGFIALLLLAALASTTGFSFVHLLFALFCGDHLGYSRAETSYAFAYVGVLGVVVQGGLLRRLLKRDIEKQLVVIGGLVLATSLYLLPRVQGTGPFLAVLALMAIGNGFIVPTLSGMVSRHVHGRAQGRVLGLNSAAGSLGRFLGPMLAALPLPLAFSEWSRPLAGEQLLVINQGYLTAFSWSAGFLVLTAILAVIMRVPKEDPVAD